MQPKRARWTQSARSGPTIAHGVAQARGLFDREILRQALVDSLKKFDPRDQVKNPVMFVVLVGSFVTLIEAIAHPGIFTWTSRSGCSSP